MCDVYCKFMFTFSMFGGFVIAAIIPVLYEMEGGEMKHLNSDQLTSLYFDYINYRDLLPKGVACCSVLEFYNCNKGNYEY